MTTSPTSTDPSRVIASLARDQVNLELKTVDLCFLAGLYLKADKAALTSFEEDVLIDMFEQVCDVVEPGAENPRKRATHAIQRLREQRMLARVDAAGLVRAGDYALTTLAAALVQYFLADEALTRESLTLLTGTLSAQLAEVLAAAKKATDAESWRSKVSGPLRVTVSELVSGIERRQRGLDAQQEEVQAEIATLLSADWLSALESCQLLLDTTTGTLNELNAILLRDTNQFQALLQDIQARAEAADNDEAAETVQRVIEHVDRIAAWGSVRQQAWSEYYQYVHRYLRDVVRLDPDRALSQRLRDQTATWPASPFFLVVAPAPAMRLLRALEVRVERPPVQRPLTERETEPEWTPPENVHADIEILVVQALDDGAATLAEVSERVLAKLPESLHYAATGRIADAALRLGRVHSEHERPWAPVLSRLEVEDWSVDGRDTS
ncbi:MAG: condensin subunit MukF [Myxococcales bacterium 68-20]|nr:chromosome partition protein MukF [Myxococcales bacterium]OJY26310.1 MAG: condensin subunit MukF [Myxococcales bacterium 68-20]